MLDIDRFLNATVLYMINNNLISFEAQESLASDDTESLWSIITRACLRNNDIAAAQNFKKICISNFENFQTTFQDIYRN